MHYMVKIKAIYVHPESVLLGMETVDLIAQSGDTEAERNDFDYVEW